VDVRTAYNLGYAALVRAEAQAWRVLQREEPPPEDSDIIAPDTVAGISTFGLRPVVDAFNGALDAVLDFFELARRSQDEPERDALSTAHRRLRDANVTLAQAIRSELRPDGARDGRGLPPGDRLDT
jgi:hypothetical protein